MKCALFLPYLTGNNAARTIGGDYIPNLLTLYNDLHQTDTKHRHISIRKAILNILKNVTSLSKFVKFCISTLFYLKKGSHIRSPEMKVDMTGCGYYPNFNTVNKTTNAHPPSQNINIFDLIIYIYEIV